jgi:two-component system chemotaxis sensor kinase CheA
MDEYKARFRSEVSELLEGLEGRLLQLEKKPNDSEAIAELFRVMHTIKGTASMFGFTNMGKLTHDVEDLFQVIRSGEMRADERVINISFKTVDLLKRLLETGDKLSEELGISFNSILDEVTSILSDDSFKSEFADRDINEQKVIEDVNFYYIRYQPDQDILSRGIEPLSVFEELEEEGAFMAFLDMDLVPSIDDFDTEKSFLAWDIFCTGFNDQETVEDVFLFFLSHEYSVQKFSGKVASELDESDEILKRLSHYDVNEKNLVHRLAELCADCSQDIEDIETTDSETENREQSISDVQQIETIRVDAKRLDELINLVSELVTINGQLDLTADKMKDSLLQKQISELGKLSKRFRDNALNLRLVAVDVLSVKMQRVVRDLSAELGKQIDFITEGTNTELDKSIINRLEGPVLHIIRNSIDHAIEMPEERLAQNKPEKGVIRFIAFYSGANVFIQIQDDGKGIDPAKIREKALQKGLMKADALLADEEVFNLIFEPGFSTAETVSNVSGRGVGLDSVRKQIADMRGQVDVESEVGLGTSFTIKLPLTLSIIDSLMVGVANNVILIPMEYIVKTMFVEDASQPRIKYEDGFIPLINMRSVLDLEPSDQKMRVLIIRYYNHRYAIAVDRIMRDYQAVVKPLGAYNRHHPFFSGSSILGDGSLALILDINRLIKYQKQNNAQSI